MVLDHFDAAIRLLASAGSRRKLLHLMAIAALPAANGLPAIFMPEDAAAKDRRRRRKQRHQRSKDPGSNKKRRRKAPCTPDPISQTCAGRCGDIANNCRQRVNCGSCACAEGCGDCFICQGSPGAPGTCVVDPARQGMACGESGQVCQPDGLCSCDDSSCAPCETCQLDGQCSAPCAGRGCCDTLGVCQDGDALASCGRNGETCVACAGDDVCRAEDQGGACRVNQPPTAATFSVTDNWGQVCVPITVFGADLEGDSLRFEVTGAPSNGRLFVYAEDQPDFLGSQVNVGNPVLPAEPGTGRRRLCYRPNSPFFSGFDGFRYRTLDQHGAVSPSASVDITIVEN